MSNDSDIDRLASALKKLRGSKGRLSPAKVSKQSIFAEMLGRGDFQRAYEILRGELQRAVVSPSRGQRAAAWSLLIEEVSCEGRLKAAGVLMHAEARTVRGWADNGGWQEIAGELIYATGAGRPVARQTTFLRYPTKEQGLAMTFIVEVPLVNRDFDRPVIRVNDIDYVDESDHIVKVDEESGVVEHEYGLELMGVPMPPENARDVEAPVLKIQFTVPLAVRMTHRFVSDFKSNSYYVASNSVGQSQISFVVFRPESE